MTGNKTFVKSVRLDSKGTKKLEAVHDFIKDRHETALANGNINYLHKWTYSNTFQQLINEYYANLEEEGYINDNGKYNGKN
jgi:hypothetical protein